MTVREMQQDAMRRILAESERAKAKRLAHSFLGAFSANRTDEDYKNYNTDFIQLCPLIAPLPLSAPCLSRVG